MRNLRHSIALALAFFCSRTQASSYNVPLISPRTPSLVQRRSRGRQSLRKVLLASSSSTPKTASLAQDSGSLINPIPPPSTVEAVPKWEELPFQWKLIFGAVEIAYTVGTQWVSGFATAYIFGSVTGVVGFAKPPTEGLSRLARWNQRNVKWGKSWGSVSASFSGFDTGVRLLRNNKVDEWNSILGSACAGAFFVRSQGPASMVKSACLYAAFGYFFMRAGQSKQIFLEEQEL
ncbi:Tim17/Tim22/Tim23/Pmp24 family [Fragilaria crotonensis]|nr:Tim17/Tim22/Tim23/Pmp24 family [Fragilaria crotonensis]